MTTPPTSRSASEQIDPYRPRFGRTRPVIVVLAENTATELTDFVIPYSILAELGAAEVLAVATGPGLIKMRPAMQVRPQATIARFDAQYPEGADYVVVPAMEKSDDPVLVAWVASQGAKGATIVSICDGALVVANSGLMDGHRATVHWATQSLREKKYPGTIWLRNVRYVADGRIVSSAGISAAVPTSLALVEAIAGHAETAALAARLGVANWSSAHNSEVFRLRVARNFLALIKTNYTNRWFHSRERIGIPLEEGVDEMAVAFTADAYSRTGRSQATGVASSIGHIRTRYGLTFVPDQVSGSSVVDAMLPSFSEAPSVRALDHALEGIAQRYGHRTAYAVSLEFEYPAHP